MKLHEFDLLFTGIIFFGSNLVSRLTFFRWVRIRLWSWLTQIVCLFVFTVVCWNHFFQLLEDWNVMIPIIAVIMFNSLHTTLSNPIIVSIDGIIGAGKTTLCHKLQRYLEQKYKLRVRLVLEPVKKWRESGLLQQYYDDQVNKVHQIPFMFQVNAFVTRIQACIDALKPNTEVYILERSIYSDTIFVQTLEQENTIPVNFVSCYQSIWNLAKPRMPFKIDLMVYLNTSVNESERRRVVRDRIEETGVMLSYQERLKRNHDLRFINNVNETGNDLKHKQLFPFTDTKNVLVIDAIKADINVDDAKYEIVLEEIAKRMDVWTFRKLWKRT